MHGYPGHDHSVCVADGTRWLRAHGGNLLAPEQQASLVAAGRWLAYVPMRRGVGRRSSVYALAPTAYEAIRKAMLQALSDWGSWPVVDTAPFEVP